MKKKKKSTQGGTFLPVRTHPTEQIKAWSREKIPELEGVSLQTKSVVLWELRWEGISEGHLEQFPRS